jgi:hypothetical protein
VGVAPLGVGRRERGRVVGRELRAGQPPVAQAGGPIDGGRGMTPDPHLERLGRHRSDAGAVDRLTGRQATDHVEGLLESPSSPAHVGAHGRELGTAAADGALHDEPACGDRRQRPHLLGHQHRVPQRQQVERTRGAVAPFGQQAAEHR